MSFRYRKVVPDRLFFKTYGYQKVSPEEMKEIIKRVQKQTHNREFAHNECYDNRLGGSRASSATSCKRAASARSEIRNPSARPRPCSAPPEETDRIFRRLRRPTLSYRASRGEFAPSYESDFRQQRELNTKPEPTPKEQRKAISRLQRPTTAFRYRSGEGSRNDPRVQRYQEYDFSDDKVASPEKVAEIIDRISAPTIASEGGIGPMCPKRRDSIGRNARLNKPLPLISGLPRSKNVDEIVDRLSRPNSSGVHGRCRPKSAFASNFDTIPSARSRRTKSANVQRASNSNENDYENDSDLMTSRSVEIIETGSEASTARSRSPRDENTENDLNDSAGKTEKRSSDGHVSETKKDSTMSDNTSRSSVNSSRSSFQKSSFASDSSDTLKTSSKEE